MSSAGRLLIVNADDFGLTSGINRAIIRAASEGVVTSVSVLPNGDAWAKDIESLRGINVGIGAHLAIVGGGSPVLSPTEVPSLVDRNGKFALSWPTVARRCALGRINTDDLQREFSAQISVLRSSGVSLTHLDTHQNVHLWPTIGRVVVGLAKEENIPFVRIPRTRSFTPLARGVATLSAHLRRLVVRAGLSTTDTSAGFDEAGALAIDRLRNVLQSLGESNALRADIICHPGEAGDADLGDYSWGFLWAEETSALIDPAIRQQIVSNGFTLGNYRDLSTNTKSES